MMRRPTPQCLQHVTIHPWEFCAYSLGCLLSSSGCLCRYYRYHTGPLRGLISQLSKYFPAALNGGAWYKTAVSPNRTLFCFNLLKCKAFMREHLISLKQMQNFFFLQVCSSRSVCRAVEPQFMEPWSALWLCPLACREHFSEVKRKRGSKHFFPRSTR